MHLIFAQLILIFVFLVCSPPPTLAQQSQITPIAEADTLNADERQWWQQQGTTKVDNELDCSPFNFYQFGQPQGFSVDNLKLLAKPINLNFENPSGSAFEADISEARWDLLQRISPALVGLSLLPMYLMP